MSLAHPPSQDANACMHCTNSAADVGGLAQLPMCSLCARGCILLRPKTQPAVVAGCCTHTHTRYSPEQLYEVVSSVQHYSQFVPWCVGSHVLKRQQDGHYLEAELQIGFQMISER